MAHVKSVIPVKTGIHPIFDTCDAPGAGDKPPRYVPDCPGLEWPDVSDNI